MEEGDSVQTILVEFIKQNSIMILLILIGSVLGIIGIFQYLASKNSETVQFVQAEESKKQNVEGISTNSNSSKTVDVEGEVLKPGVYTLKGEARIKDALDAAGGLSSKADKDYVSKKLNLAQKIADGVKIYIPRIGENPSNFQIIPQIVQENASSDPDSGLININSANESRLDTLPKVGPVTAQKIIAGRPYSNIEELVSKKVVTQKVFDGMRDKITAQ